MSIIILTSLILAISFMVWAIYITFMGKPLSLVTLSIFTLIALSDIEWNYIHRQMLKSDIKKLQDQVVELQAKK